MDWQDLTGKREGVMHVQDDTHTCTLWPGLRSQVHPAGVAGASHTTTWSAELSVCVCVCVDIIIIYTIISRVYVHRVTKPPVMARRSASCTRACSMGPLLYVFMSIVGRSEVEHEEEIPWYERTLFESTLKHCGWSYMDGGWSYMDGGQEDIPPCTVPCYFIPQNRSYSDQDHIVRVGVDLANRKKIICNLKRSRSNHIHGLKTYVYKKFCCSPESRKWNSYLSACPVLCFLAWNLEHGHWASARLLVYYSALRLVGLPALSLLAPSHNTQSLPH